MADGSALTKLMDKVVSERKKIPSREAETAASP
jgi:hypothetical protein